ncbi:MAG: type II toxin-antitoxin system VapC family toxin [Oceanipulchritudo sp.]
MILDTTFLVDLERERRRGEDGPAMRFLEAHGEEHFAITFTIAGELAAGKSLGRDRAKWERFIEPFRFLDYSSEVGWLFGNAFRDLQANGQLIGANDLWIAATALANNLGVVTRNAREFARVRGLEVIGY